MLLLGNNVQVFDANYKLMKDLKGPPVGSLATKDKKLSFMNEVAVPLCTALKALSPKINFKWVAIRDACRKWHADEAMHEEASSDRKSIAITDIIKFYKAKSRVYKGKKPQSKCAGKKGNGKGPGHEAYHSIKCCVA